MFSVTARPTVNETNGPVTQNRAEDIFSVSYRRATTSAASDRYDHIPGIGPFHSDIAAGLSSAHK
jgi:hypothetical protein